MLGLGWAMTALAELGAAAAAQAAMAHTSTVAFALAYLLSIVFNTCRSLASTV